MTSRKKKLGIILLAIACAAAAGTGASTYTKNNTGTGTFTYNTSGTVTVPNATDTLVGKATTDTLTNKTINSCTINTPTLVGSGGTLTLPAGPDTLVGRATTDTLTNKTISGASNTISNISLASQVTGNLPVTNLNSGTSASATTFWRGDGTWATPAGAGNVSGPGSSHAHGVAQFADTTGTLLEEASFTQHNALTAGANGTFSSVSPSTAGKVFVSDGTDWTSTTSLASASGYAIHGTNTNDSASAGYVGEYASASSAGTAAAFPATGVWGDAGSISLTAGDWDVTACFTLELNSSTITNNYCSYGVSTTSGDSVTGLTNADTTASVNANTGTNSADPGVCISNIRKSLSATTTVYAKVGCNYTAGTPKYNYRLSARRVR